ncbi:MAG: DUF4268 domain-containing protein [Myxococcota bacterium]
MGKHDVPALGRLEKVSLRSVWADEAASFTPWLATEENIELLGDTIGLTLEVEAQEKEVGPFRADILCRDHFDEEHWVLVENQLERTDHTHLGQLITYAAGLNAVTIVWISARFTEEHRAAIDWLNAITDEAFRFFGLEVEAWRIGASPPAPKFNIVSKPNDWSRQVASAAQRASGELSEVKSLQLEFWTELRDHVNQHATHVHAGRKARPQHWLNFRIGRSGFCLSAVASTWSSAGSDCHELRAELVMFGESACDAFASLSKDREAVESEMGETLEWYSTEGVTKRRVFVSREADLRDRASWSEYHAWLTQKLDRLHEVFQTRVIDLELPGDTEPDEFA